MSRRAWVIFKKELIDNLRDRRSLRNVGVSLLLSAGMLAFSLWGLSQLGNAGGLKPVDLPVEGAEHAPGLIEYLRNQNINVLPPVPQPEEAIRNLEQKVVLMVPPSYATDFREGDPATVRLIYDDSQVGARDDVRRVKDLLNQYSRTVGSLRLMVRGVEPSVLFAVAVENTNLATPLARAYILLAMIPLLLLVSVQNAGMYAAIDAMTGERERGSLEALLIAPITPSDLVLGKLGATVVFAAVALGLSVLGTGLALNYTPVDLPGMQLELSLGRGLLMVALFLPAALAICAGQLLAASRSASFKEAQSAMQYVMMVTMVPSFMEMYVPFKPPVWSMLIPVYSQTHLAGKVVRGEVMELNMLLASVGGTLTLFVGLVMASVYLYDRERALFAARG